MKVQQKTAKIAFRFLRVLGFKRGRRGVSPPIIEKRQKFIIAVLVLSLGLFLAEFQFSKSGFFIVSFLSILTSVFLFWAIHADVKENKSYEAFILPFFYSFAFGSFYFLTPAIFLSRTILTIVYAFGLYSLFLSQNILVVSSMRTIGLLSGARIVTFVITLVSYFFLTNITYSLHITIFLTLLIVLIYTYCLTYSSLWTYNLQKGVQSMGVWISTLTVCLVEVATILWFWPSSPTVIGLFLTGFFYTMIGISHIWFERKLFKGILWEYIWVGCATFFMLILFSPWGK